MDNSKLETEWAWSQVEAMAEGTLEPAEVLRMRRAMEREPDLGGAVDDARAVLRALQSMQSDKPPVRLLNRLLAGRPRRSTMRLPFARPGVAAMGAGVFATAAIAFMFATLVVRTPDPAEQAAIRDFAIAMNYLRRSAAVARDEVNQQLGEGLVTALQISTQTLARDDKANETNGG